MPRKTIPLPDQARLKAVLDYDPLTGVLTWKTRPASDFEGRKYPSDRLAKSWNSNNAGKPALEIPDPHGYFHGGIDGVAYKAARVIWKWMTGDDPDTIDHINGTITDNRWANLRNGTPVQNQRNQRKPKTNKSGKVGVRQTRWGSWKAEIGLHGRNVSLGSFATFEEAAAARDGAEKLYAFDPTHGRR